jgi:WD40 repeat protein
MAADGRTAISTSEDGTARLWDLSAARQMAVSSNPAGALGRVAMSADRSVGVWEVENADAPAWLKGHSTAINCVEMSADGKLVVTASQDHSLKVWDLRRRQLIASFRSDSSISVCAIVRSDIFVCGDETGAVHFLRLENAGVGLQKGAGSPRV